MSLLLTLSEVHARMLDRVSEHGSQAAYARALGIEFKTLNVAIRRGTGVPMRVLEDLGLAAVVRYEPRSSTRAA